MGENVANAKSWEWHSQGLDCPWTARLYRSGLGKREAPWHPWPKVDRGAGIGRGGSPVGSDELTSWLWSIVDRCGRHSRHFICGSTEKVLTRDLHCTFLTSLTFLDLSTTHTGALSSKKHWMHFIPISPNPNSYLTSPKFTYLRHHLYLYPVRTATAAKPPLPMLCAYVQTYASWATTFLLPILGCHAWAI